MPRERAEKLIHNCRKDEGMALRYRFVGRDVKPPKAAVVKSHGSERLGKSLLESGEV